MIGPTGPVEFFPKDYPSKFLISATTRLLATSVVTMLTGCGTHVPEFQENPWEHNVESLIQAIASSIHCELRNAVIYVKNTDLWSKPYNHRLVANWLDTWGAQVNLTLTADELSTITPSFHTPPAKYSRYWVEPPYLLKQPELGNWIIITPSRSFKLTAHVLQNIWQKMPRVTIRLVPL